MATSSTYTIKNTQGTLSFIINVGSANGPLETTQQADLTFYGYGRTGWGQEVDQNFYRLLENFACAELTSSPSVPKTKIDLGGVLGINKPVVGQQWFNLTTSEMYVCSDTTANTWKHLVSADYLAANYVSAGGAVATYLKLDGSNSPMTGFLTLNAPPTASLHAATKEYVDTTASTTLSTVNGAYVHKAGDTMTGTLTITTTTPNDSFTRILVEGTNTYPAIQMGRQNGIATQAAFAFWTSGSSTTIDSLIVASGGTAGVANQGTINLTGFILDDGRTPTLANQLVHKSWVDSAISTAISGAGGAASALYLRKAGDTMTGQLNMNGNIIQNVGGPSGPYSATPWVSVYNNCYAPAGIGFAHQIIISWGGPGGYNDGDIWFQL